VATQRDDPLRAQALGRQHAGQADGAVADDGLTVAVFTAEPGSPSEQALGLLGSWAATPDAAAPAVGAD
jgi:hypothetical protein